MMELIFDSYKDLPLTENHIQQLHHILLKYSEKDDRHRGYYKKFPNHAEAFDESGQSLGVVFETATPFETPGLMKDLVNLTNHSLDSPESLIGDWISFFINCLFIQKNILVKKIDQERLTAALPPLSEKIMEVLKSRGKVTVKEAGALTGANRNTIKDHLKKLADSGHIIQKGVGRGAWYEKK